MTSKSTDAAQTPDWKKLKLSGNELYSKKKYIEANDLYTKSIDLLQDNNNNNNKIVKDTGTKTARDVDGDLSKLFSNCSLCYYQLSQGTTSSEKTDYLEKSLMYGKKSVKLDANFYKGHFRCGLALCALGRKDEAIPYAKSVLDLYAKSGQNYEEDKFLVSFLEDCNYFASSVRSSPVWDKVKFKENFKIVEPKHGHLENILTNDTKKLSMILKPGYYRLVKSVIVHPGQEVQIIGDIRRAKDVITIECQGGPFDSTTCHLFVVKGGKLSLNNIRLQQSAGHPEVHSIFVQSGGEIVTESCTFTSKCSACVAVTQDSKLYMNDCHFDRACGGVISVSGSRSTIENSTFTNLKKIGIETRDGAFSKIVNTKVVGCGSQAVVSHANAKGFSAERCVFKDNSQSLHGQETSINCASGSSSVTECIFENNKGGGVMVQEGGYCAITKSSFVGGRVGLAASMKGAANMKDCTISDTTLGVAIIFNLEGKIVLDSNSMQRVKGTEVLLTPDDIAPEMINSKHQVLSKGMASGVMKAGLKADMATKKKDRFGLTPSWTDPNERDPTEERTCTPCGLTQRALGTRFMVCAGCKLSWYCSKKCQKSDWKLHKPVCLSVKSLMKEA